MAKYTLMHKNIEVLDMKLNDDLGGVEKIYKVYNIEHVPVSVLRIKKSIDKSSLNNWWINRSIPASRMGLRDALFKLKIMNTTKLVEAALGLSLSDQYWIKPENKKMRWEDINFFYNEFSEDVGEILFGKAKRSFSLLSPDNTSDGWLKKKWKIVDNKRCLIKCGSGTNRQEPYNEVIASIIAKRLGISHVPYKLIHISEEPYSLCENFVTKDTEFVDAWDFMKNEKKENHVSIYRHYLDCANKYGIENMKEFLDKMIVLDYIMINEDRHFGNFGLIRDANSLEYIGPAPVFDTGTSLLLNTPTSFISTYSKNICKPFKKSHNEQIKLVSTFDWLDFDKLENIEEEIKEVFGNTMYIETQRIKGICDVVRGKIDDLRLLSVSHLAEDNIEYDLEENIQYFGE